MNGVESHVISPAFDPDVYVVNLTAGHTYKIAYEEGNNPIKQLSSGIAAPMPEHESTMLLRCGTVNYSQVVYSSDSSQDDMSSPLRENGTYYFATATDGTKQPPVRTNYTLEIEQTPSAKSNPVDKVA